MPQLNLGSWAFRVSAHAIMGKTQPPCVRDVCHSDVFTRYFIKMNYFQSVVTTANSPAANEPHSHQMLALCTSFTCVLTYSLTVDGRWKKVCEDEEEAIARRAWCSSWHTWPGVLLGTCFIPVLAFRCANWQSLSETAQFHVDCAVFKFYVLWAYFWTCTKIIVLSSIIIRNATLPFQLQRAQNNAQLWY